MKITIDTDNKIIEIEKATSEELIKIANDYPGFTVQSKFALQFFPTHPSYPAFDPNIVPYYGTININGTTGGGGINTTSGDTLKVNNGTTTKVGSNWSYTTETKQ